MHSSFQKHQVKQNKNLDVYAKSVFEKLIMVFSVTLKKITLYTFMLILAISMHSKILFYIVVI